MTRARLSGPERCRRKFLRFFPGGFADETYDDWERAYKWKAHEQWDEQLRRSELRSLLHGGDYAEARAIRIESRTNLLFSFEKMALRDAVKPPAGARTFANALNELLHGRGADRQHFERWCEAIASLPRRQTCGCKGRRNTSEWNHKSGRRRSGRS